ncbi:MAG: hypothetical protein JSS02_15715 [Planctomycetes bacterium]|nr:hypothetical protein [Planctomycetota bacterium]
MQSHLSALSRRRWLARTVFGAMAWGLTLLLVLVAAFALDWTFRFPREQRILVLAGFAGVALWAFRRWVWPALVTHESVIDLALQVERRQQIDSDLVAALQFESAGAQSWGSPELATAVVDRVAVSSRTLRVAEGMSEVPLGRRALPLVLVAVMLTVLGALFPAHLSAFCNRFLLGSAQYPTHTQITRVTINGLEAFPALPAGSDVKIPFGSTLEFEVSAAGELPETGEVELTAEEGTAAITLPLTAIAGTPGHFSADLGRSPEAVTYQVHLGDAWTVPGRIVVVLPPVVVMDLEHTPPVYAANPRLARGATGSRQISVMEGSRVAVAIRCMNKPLARCDLIVGESRFPMEAVDAERRNWKTGPGTPLDDIAAATAFQVEAVDVDGLSPDQPLQGQIQIQADRAPRIAGAVVTEKVLPGARPGITWGAADDHGVAEIRLVKQVTRASGEISETQELVKRVPPAEQPQASLRGRHVVDLKSLNLAKGDEVRVTLEATDYRGHRPGVVAHSEPIVFSVTDETGVLAGLVEADEKSARQLDQIIQRQLGIGENR